MNTLVWLIGIALCLFGATVEGAIFFLIASVNSCAEDIIRAIQKGAE